MALELKGELMCTLASLVDGPDTALAVWDELERSQVLQTAPTSHSSGMRRSGGIKQELKASFNYPCVCGFLRLLNSLVAHRVPVHLGARYRVPGIQPYFDFVRQDVFLRRPPGRQPSERWEAVALSLEFFCQFADSYEVFCDPRRPGIPTAALPPALAAAAEALAVGAHATAAAAPVSVGGRPETDFVLLPDIPLRGVEYVGRVAQAGDAAVLSPPTCACVEPAGLCAWCPWPPPDVLAAWYAVVTGTLCAPSSPSRLATTSCTHSCRVRTTSACSWT